MTLHSIIRTLGAAALIAVPSIAMAAPDQNTNNGQYNNGCYGQWINGQCVQNNNGNGNWHNDRRRHRDRDNGNDNNGYNGNANGYRGGEMSGTVSSFSPYNLYLNNGMHVELHNGTVINPRGTNLTPGQRVRVIGNRNADGTFNANEIDVVGNGYAGNRYLR